MSRFPHPAAKFADPPADKCVGVLGLLRRGVVPGADRPDRFVSDHQTRQPVTGNILQAVGHLHVQDGLGLVKKKGDADFPKKVRVPFLLPASHR